MNFEQKIKRLPQSEIWREYCSFLELDLPAYMRIQKRLMEEQIALWKQSELGETFLKGQELAGIDDFRRRMPLTNYEDYADVLLKKRDEMLPAEPIIWVQTTWEGGRHPYKVAPYTEGMLETFRNNIAACMILSTAKGRTSFTIRPGDRMLYALAPLPYVTGLLPLALGEEISIDFLPPVKEATQMSFGERNQRGFQMGLKRGGIDFLFGLGSVVYYVSQTLSTLGAAARSLGDERARRVPPSARMALRYLRAKRRCKREGRALKPKDIFTLKGLVVAGTDNDCYKDELEDLWGIRPMEIFAGTEPSLIGTETESREGIYFFPDTCFYEFIPEAEMLRSLQHPSYQPKTYLMDELLPGQVYELVVSVLRGGAFMRYRAGDMYRCLGLEHAGDGTRLPRFEYIDRVPTIIDIAGFTRITQYTVESAIALSGLRIENWVARKQYTENRRPYILMVVEFTADNLAYAAVSKELLREHLGIYFKHVDEDYQDLKRLLDVEPLEITIVPCGTFARYYANTARAIDHINPSYYELKELLDQAAAL